MGVLVVPRPDEAEWPTLGGQICQFLTERAVHGPGDLRGQRPRLDEETRALIFRMFEVFPRGHPQAGRRRFKRVALSLRKGTAKTEKAAWIAYVELHPEGPVRCDGFDASGEPVGVPVADPYIPMISYTAEQTEDLAYAALYVVVTEGPDADLFDAGLERIIRLDPRGRAAGKAVPLASAPDARDGARTTFQHFDETHRLTLPRLKEAHQTMLANVPKRFVADAWSLETTTAPEPGGGSVAERTMEYAEAVAQGRVSDSRLFFFHREASKGLDELDGDQEAVRAAVIEASGPAASWSDIDGIVDLWRDPTTDLAFFERVWLNRKVAGKGRAFDAVRWAELADPDVTVPDGAQITIGFDGSRWDDATALVATALESGWQWPLGIWEAPFGADVWEVPVDDVEATVADAFDRYQVVRMLADPPYWRSEVAGWAGRWGNRVVIEFWTNALKSTAYAVKAFDEAIRAGTISHDADETLGRHIGNAWRRPINLRDDQGKRLWTIGKERSDSPAKIDAAMAAVLSWQARTDAIASGAIKPPRRRIRTGFGSIG